MEKQITLLSEREQEVLYWLTAGATNREIGHCLCIEESTVKRHVYNIFGKLKVGNRTEAALWAMRRDVTRWLTYRKDYA